MNYKLEAISNSISPASQGIDLPYCKFSKLVTNYISHIL